MAARLVDGEAADMIELGGEAAKPSGERARPKVRPAVDDHARWLALGVGVDDPHRSGLRARPGGPPGAERREPSLRHALLRGAERVEGVQLRRIFVVAGERHQALEIEDEIDALVEL